MDEFIDITGASPAAYRFRSVEHPAQLPATAGNFVILDAGGGGEEVVCCGTALSLLEAAEAWKSVLRAHPAGRMFVRLNVFRSARVGEHDDIVAQHDPRRVFFELDQAPAQADAGVATVGAVGG